MVAPKLVAEIRRKFKALAPSMDERMRRHWAAAEAREVGRGGIAAVQAATGLSRPTITSGIREIAMPAKIRAAAGARIRRAGGGRRALIENDPGLLAALEGLIDSSTRGHPQSPLRWTCKSTRRLADELTLQDHRVSARTVAALLTQSGYSLQANRKTVEGASHPDRDSQFEYISASVQRFHKRGQPAISVDTKKKELVGPFRNGGREWKAAGSPEKVRVHDFLDDSLGKAIPYGVYDILNNQGWVSVGVDHDTAQFATNSIRRWWKQMGKKRFPRARELLITADGGGSNGHRSRLWKVELQKLADDLGLTVVVSHFPPGTSKWNKIEHRLFSFITQNWRGRPLISRQVIVNLIASTTTRAGLVVKAALDTTLYEVSIKVSDDQLAKIRLAPHPFHGNWNYSIKPHTL